MIQLSLQIDEYIYRIHFRILLSFKRLNMFSNSFPNYLIASRFGRRKPLCTYLLLGSVMNITAGVLSEKAGQFLRSRFSRRRLN